MKKLVILSLIFTGCVLSGPPPRNSRFSVDNSKLQKVDFYKDTWVYRHPTKRITDYHEFYLAPIDMYLNTAKKVSAEDKKFFADVAEEWLEPIKNNMKKNYTMVDKPGDGVLEMIISIQDIKPIVTFIKPDGNEAVVTDTTLKGTKLEIECDDYTTREPIYQMSTLYKGDEYEAYKDISLLPNVRIAFTEWIAYFKNKFDEATAQKK